MQLSLISGAGLITADDELGWVHLHTSWLQHAGDVADVQPADAQEADAHSDGAGKRRTLTLARSEVDLVNKDSRFPPDWTITLLYACDDDQVEFCL